MIQLDGLTKRQVELLDLMWNIDSPEDIESFVDSLGQSDQDDCRILMNMIMLEIVEQAVDELPDYSEANEILDQFRLGK